MPALDSITNVTENGTVPLEAYVGLLLDDVEPYQNFQNNTDLADIAEIILFADPTFNDFTEKGRVRVFRPYPPYKHHSVEIVVRQFALFSNALCLTQIFQTEH